MGFIDAYGREFWRLLDNHSDMYDLQAYLDYALPHPSKRLGGLRPFSHKAVAGALEPAKLVSDGPVKV
jgi:hypothetical protein